MTIRSLVSPGRSWPLSVRDPATGRALDLLRGGRPAVYSTGPTVIAAGSAALANVRFDNLFAFMITTVRGLTTVANSVALEFTDQRLGYAWQDRPCQLELVTGTGLTPYRLPIPVLMVPDAQGAGPVLSTRMSDIIGAGATAEVAFEGIALPLSNFPDKVVDALQRRRPFYYSRALAIAAGLGTGTGQALYQIHDDSVFDWLDIQASARTLYDVTLQALGERLTFTPTPTRIEELAGLGTFPGSFSMPLRIRKGDTVALNAVNRQAGAQTVETVLAGRKVFA